MTSRALPTVLVVDDTETNIDLLVDILSDQYYVSVALEGESALDAAMDKPDLILLDVMMPDMDGYEVCRRLKENPTTKDIPVIFVTAKSGVNDENKGLELGAIDYITKPFSPPVVLARVRNHLALHLVQQEIKRKNEALSQWQQQMALLMRHTPSAIAMFDTDLRYLQVSHRWLEDYNLKNMDVRGQSHLDLFPDMSEHWRMIFRRCLEGIWGKNEADPIKNERSGMIQWIKWEAFPWKNASGEVMAIMMYTEDVTERKLLEIEITQHRDRLAYEQGLVRNAIEKMQASHPFCSSGVCYLSIPVDTVSGDIVLSMLRPDGGQHIMVGDFTGHGIPAAICGPLTADIFCAMSIKGLDMGEIVHEVNKKLFKQTPRDMFLVAAFLELNPERNCLRVWNCSSPDILVMREGRLHRRIESRFLPRGVLLRTEVPPESITVRSGDRIFVSTDGIIETMNLNGEPLGIETLGEMIEQMIKGGEPLESLGNIIHKFRAGKAQEDDLTILEMTC